MKENVVYNFADDPCPWRLVVLDKWGRDETYYSTREAAERACKGILARGVFAYVRFDGPQL